MRISIIVAMAENRVIGRDGQLPWHLPADLKRFKRITMGKPMVMGRKTFESLGGLLPGRENIVLTRQRGYQPEGVRVFGDLQDAADTLRAEGCEELFIGGGTEVYRQGLALAGRIYLTVIHRPYEGDATFPEFDELQYRVIERERYDDPLPYEFVTYERI